MEPSRFAMTRHERSGFGPLSHERLDCSAFRVRVQHNHLAVDIDEHPWASPERADVTNRRRPRHAQNGQGRAGGPAAWMRVVLAEFGQLAVSSLYRRPAFASSSNGSHGDGQARRTRRPFGEPLPPLHIGSVRGWQIAAPSSSTTSSRPNGRWVERPHGDAAVITVPTPPPTRGSASPATSVRCRRRARRGPGRWPPPSCWGADGTDPAPGSPRPR